jgi:hypothetical protein
VNHKTFPPAFNAAMNHYQLIARLNGDESDKARIAFTKAVLKAPKWFADEARPMVKEMELIPAPTGYLDDGQPIFSLNDLAKTLDIPIEQAEKSMFEMVAELFSNGITDIYIERVMFKRELVQ